MQGYRKDNSAERIEPAQRRALVVGERKCDADGGGGERVEQGCADKAQVAG